MESTAQKFNDFIRDNIKFDNKYVSAIIFLLVIGYVSVYTPKLPDAILKLMDNILMKILLVFLFLYMNFNTEPFVSLVVSISFVIMLLVLNSLNKDKETMALITGIQQTSIPEYAIPSCSKRIRNCGLDECKLSGTLDEIVGATKHGIVSDVPNAEIESLCTHLKKDKNAMDEILTGSSFSELIDADKQCKFAKHQYHMKFPNVNCAENVSGNSVQFPSELALE